MTEKDFRELVTYCLERWDSKSAKDMLRLALLEGVPVKDMADLHYPLLALLAMPATDKGGRPKDPDAERRKMRERMACTLKAELTGESFSAVWSQCGRGARPSKLDVEPWRCSAYLQDALEVDQERATALLRQFDLTLEDLLILYDHAAKKPAEVFMADGGDKGQ